MITFKNMPINSGKLEFVLRYILNVCRTWFLFTFKYSWVKYNGFIRVMKGTSFAKMKISLGHNVQFGDYCNVANNVIIGNYVLLAARVCFVGKNDHTFNIPGEYIWEGERIKDEPCIIEDDVWIGHNTTIVGGVKISKGSIVAAGSVVTKDIPTCEIWGGVPAKKIRNRFDKPEETQIHIAFLENNSTKK